MDGEGPFRVVPPQLVPTPPDQSSRAENQAVVWPYNYDWDHNAGSASRSATIIKVDPLPPGTTDIDILEAGWQYVDDAKLIIYGAIAGTPVIDLNLDIEIPCILVEDAKWQIEIGFTPQTSDPNWFYWKLEDIQATEDFESSGACAIFSMEILVFIFLF